MNQPPGFANPWAAPPPKPAGRWPRRILLIAGFLLALAAIDRTGAAIGLLRRTEPAEAVLVELRDEFVPGYRLRDQKWLYRPVIRFTTAQGEEVVAPAAELVPTSTSLRPGGRVPVRYDPAAPAERPRIGGALGIWWPALAAWLQTAAFLALVWHWPRLVRLIPRRWLGRAP